MTAAGAQRRPDARTRVWWWLIALPGRLVTREWIIAVAFTIGMASLSVAFGVVPDLAAEGWAGNPRLPWLVGFTVVAMVFLVAGAGMWWLRNTLLHRRGTAYIVEETAPGWDPEDKRAFTAAIRSQFAAVREVPGPARLRGDWEWAFDHRAALWGERLTDLVHSFRVVYINDDPTTPNALYMWAPWPVALAFGLRTHNRNRSLNLQVRARPSFGRRGTVRAVAFTDPGHTFGDPGGTQQPPAGTITVREYPVRLRVEPAGAGPPVVVLLLRTSDLPFGPLPSEPHGGTPTLSVTDGATLNLPGDALATVHEWVYQPVGQTIDWVEFPAVVASAAAWIRDRADVADGSSLLLGALLPQEVAVGIGIVAARTPNWPAHLWPMMHDPARGLVVVRLDLGRGTA
ncbi:hypothetical protein GCM10009557_36160 [Virgisporangium ochraceum]|uniref:Uncharacterized protein n=1 Tax=Virgisporangium ochraceum TaxID=65505 RepID=A0A8J3ZQ83_9ACTN|nr:hypothetical protein [Virgisporangium ochraceum]GIJ67919.1 hypothetical protein Voc01_028360 [Virgisporangium ochraceum]